MAHYPSLHWLPVAQDWRKKLIELRETRVPDWSELVSLANARIEFIATNALDEVLRRVFPQPTADVSREPIRLAMLGASTLTHLQPAIRVGALRRGMHVTIYESAYGQYLQELENVDSALYDFEPNAVLFAFDSVHLTAGIDATLSAADSEAAFLAMRRRVECCWRLAREAFRCQILQQTPLPTLPALLGNNDHRLPGSRAAIIARLNSDLRGMSDEAGVDLLALDVQAARDGLDAWHDPALWHRTKQEVSPAATPVYGDLAARLLAAAQGRSAKCLVLDLDNTIWGGAVGDDGVEGLVLGQGSALGEAFIGVQIYARELLRRGVILAVCSKNDEANALAPFNLHPEMVLRRDDFACFIANWSDKATNIRLIAEDLNIGLDAIVFVDDNSFERDLIRQELPMVSVPELPEDPALVPQCLADAGYFEGLGITEEDRQRTAQYHHNRERNALKASVTDMPSYLRSLKMQLLWRPFDRLGLSRTVQLINKTNQFNLTTRRYGESEVIAVMQESRSFGLQLRLIDRFGDNGIISVVIAHMEGSPLAPGDLTLGDLLIDTWLISCRVLGRQVEHATLNLIAERARLLGARRLVGEYRPTAKNCIVSDHYARFGFTPISEERSILELNDFAVMETSISVEQDKR